MNTRRVSVRGRAAQLLEVFTTLIISPTVIKEPGEGSHLVGLNEARSSEAADWLPGCVITFTGSEQFSLKPS